MGFHGFIFPFQFSKDIKWKYAYEDQPEVEGGVEEYLLSSNEFYFSYSISDVELYKHVLMKQLNCFYDLICAFKLLNYHLTPKRKKKRKMKNVIYREC